MRCPEDEPTAPGAELEEVGSLHEERTPLAEERLKGSEVHHCRIHLDLTEIGVDRRVQCEIAGQTVL